MIRRGPSTIRVLLAVVAVAGCLNTAGRARAEVNAIAGSDSGSAVAFVMTVSGTSWGVVPLTAADIRAAASNELTTILSRRGLSVVPQGNVLPLMREWRVRDGRAIPRGFLDSLVTGFDVRLLIVADIVAQSSRIIMTARYVDPGTGILLDVGVAEQALAGGDDTDGQRWLAAAEAACRVVGNARVAQPRPGGEPVLILETQAVGCSDTDALLAGHALLAHFVGRGLGTLIDPAVTNAALHDAGYSEKHIGPDARALLQQSFACSRLMIPQLISYAPARRANTQIDTFDESAGQQQTTAPDFALGLRSIDLASGAVTAGREVFMATPSPVGWFGAPRHDTLIGRLASTADQLWSDMNNAMEDF